MKDNQPESIEVASPGPAKPRFRVMIACPVAELGGAEQVVLGLAERLPAYSIDVAFALLRPGPLQKIIESKGFRVYVFPEEYRYRDLRSIWRCVHWLAQCIKDDGADILHSNLTAHFIGGWAARIAKVRELWHLYDYPGSFDPVHAISRFVPTDFIIFITEYLRRGEPSLQRNAHRVIYANCVDVVRLKNVPGDSAVRQRLNIGESRFFLTVTRLQEHKGHTYLIDAAAEVTREYPDVRWVIAGRPRGEEQENYFRRLRDNVATKGLQDRVLFIGFVPAEDLVPLYREALALVHPASTESYGLVLLEAMSCRLPVIAAAATGPAEIIENERNGLLVPVRDADALAGALIRLLDDPALGRRLALQASTDVERRSVDEMVQETVECYERILNLPS